MKPTTLIFGILALVLGVICMGQGGGYIPLPDETTWNSGVVLTSMGLVISLASRWI